MFSGQTYDAFMRVSVTDVKQIIFISHTANGRLIIHILWIIAQQFYDQRTTFFSVHTSTCKSLTNRLVLSHQTCPNINIVTVNLGRAFSNRNGLIVPFKVSPAYFHSHTIKV